MERNGRKGERKCIEKKGKERNWREEERMREGEDRSNVEARFQDRKERK